MNIVGFKSYENISYLKDLIKKNGINTKIIDSDLYKSFIKNNVENKTQRIIDDLISLEDISSQKSISYNIISKGSFDTENNYPVFMGYNYSMNDIYYPGITFTLFYQWETNQIADIISFSNYSQKIDNLKKEINNLGEKYHENLKHKIIAKEYGIRIDGTIISEKRIDNKDIEELLMKILS